jgi:hypothetical protein
MNDSKLGSSRSNILARMAITRAELLASSHADALTQPSAHISEAQRGPLFMRSPYAELIAASLFLSVVLGPKHIVKIAAQRALIPWILRSLRALATRS